MSQVPTHPEPLRVFLIAQSGAFLALFVVVSCLPSVCVCQALAFLEEYAMLRKADDPRSTEDREAGGPDM